MVLWLGCLAAPASFAQTLSGTLGEATDFFTFPDSSQPDGQGVLFRLRVTDGIALALAFPQRLTFAHQFSLYRTDADLAQLIPVGATVTELVTGLYLLDDSTVLDFPVAATAGEDLTLVLECSAFCDDPTLAYAFDLIGAQQLGFDPDPDPDPGLGVKTELASLTVASSGLDRLVALDAQRVTQEMGMDSLALRSASGGTLSTKSAVTSRTGRLTGSLHSWAEVTAFDSLADAGNGGMTGTGFQLGADLALGPDMVAGLSLGHADLAATDNAAGQDGALTWAQPYAAWRPGAFHGNASLILGRGGYDQTSASGDGSGETQLLAVTVAAGFDHPVGADLVLTPSLGLITGRQTVTGTTGTLAGAGAERVDFTQSSLGATITYHRAAGTVFAGLHADHLQQAPGAVLTDGFLASDGWTGRIALGASIELGSDQAGGMGLSTSIDLRGLGGTAETLSGGLQLSLRF